MIAMALANDPDVLIADEPTTALDVTVQAQILNLIRDLQKQLGMAVILITHDLTVVRQFSDYVYVMQHGEMREHNRTEKIFAIPQHPYTKHLLASEPRGRRIRCRRFRHHPRRPGRARLVHDAPRQVLQAGMKDLVAVEARSELAGTRRSASSANPVPARDLRPGACAAEGAGRRRNLFRRSAHPRGKSRADASTALADAGGFPGSVLVPQSPHDSRPDHRGRPRVNGVGATRAERLDGCARRCTPGCPAISCRASRTNFRRPAPAHRDCARHRAGTGVYPARRTDLGARPSVQAQIIDLLRRLQDERGLSYLFISHDLKVVRALCHRVDRHAEWQDY